MKKVILTATSIVALASSLQAANEDLTAKLATEKNCKNVASLVSGGLDAKSSTTLVASVLEAALKAKGACACEVVTGAIEATGASSKDKKAMIETIVGTAITTIPAETATITECAVAAAPNHASTIETVLNKTFADNDKEFLGEGSSKQGGSSKQAYGKEDSGAEVDPGVDDDFDSFAAPLPAPVYLLAPSGGVVAPGVLAPLSPSNASSD